MKNTLAENMLRFGVKNLSKENKQHLMEAEGDIQWNAKMGDPQWLLYPAGQESSHVNGLSFKYKPGATYVQQMSAAAANVQSDQAQGIYIMPKGTKWTISPSGYFIIASCLSVTSQNFGYGVDDATVTPLTRGLQDPMYLANVAMGKAKGTDGKPVTVQKSYVAVTPHSPESALAPNKSTAIKLIWPNRQLSAALNKLQAPM
jgi:hypothetical protein